MKDVRVLDLDGSLVAQGGCFPESENDWISATRVGSAVRLACSFGTYSSFRRWLGHAVSSSVPGSRSTAPGTSIT